MPLILIAQIQAIPGKEAELEALLRSLIPTTRAEAGCERYQLHRSVEDPLHFQFHERWTTREAWEAHMKAPHLGDFSARSGELVAEWKLFQLEEIA